jgi:hypothetical protein
LGGFEFSFSVTTQWFQQVKLGFHICATLSLGRFPVNDFFREAQAVLDISSMMYKKPDLSLKAWVPTNRWLASYEFRVRLRR